MMVYVQGRMEGWKWISMRGTMLSFLINFINFIKVLIRHYIIINGISEIKRRYTGLSSRVDNLSIVYHAYKSRNFFDTRVKLCFRVIGRCLIILYSLCMGK